MDVTKKHLLIAEENINSLVAPDGTMSKKWVLLLLAKVAAQGAERERAAVVRWFRKAPGLRCSCGEVADFIEAGKHRESDDE